MAPHFDTRMPRSEGKVWQPGEDAWGSAGAAGDGTGERTVGIAEFGAILRRRWITIATTTALVTSLGLSYAFLARPAYTASTAIFVDPRNRASFMIEGTGVGGSYDPNLVDSQTLLIESDTVLRRVIAAEKLQDDAEFTRGPGDPASNVLRNLQEAVKVKRPDRTYVVEIQVRTESAEKSARIANAIARAFLSDGRDSKSETAQREQSWLETHLQNLQTRLKEAEARVEAYKVENKILGVEGKLVGEQQLSELNRGLVDAQRKAAEAKAALDQVEALRRTGRMPDSTVEALKSPVIDRLRGQYAEISRLDANARSTLGPRHPAAIEVRQQLQDVQRLISEELARIAAGARSSHAVAQGNVAGLERQLEKLKGDATATNKTLLRLRELERAVDAQKAVYEKFLRDKEQIARLTVDTPAGRVIAPAVAPQRRSSPNRPLILALSLLGGLFLGVALALLRETLAGGRSTPDSRPLRSRFLTARREPASGIAPVMPRAARPAPTLLAALPPPPGGPALKWVRKGQHRSAANSLPALDAVDSAPASPFSQEITSLADRIMAMIGTQAPATLMITGAGPENGSPVLSSNLARALAGLGNDVLLVDGSGGAEGLTPRLSGTGDPVEIDVSGKIQLARRIPLGGSHALYFLPFGGARPGSSGARPRRVGDCMITLIDGPSFGSEALTRIDIDRRIDGVIALLPGGSTANDALARDIDRRFGTSLMGLVTQTRMTGRAA
jgi:polysaccharide biosynthesis transport protein